MSIRIKQMLIMLAIALLPVLVSGVLSQRKIDTMAQDIEATARFQEMERERHYLREKVADLGTSLRLVARLTEQLLGQQQALLEDALARAPTGAAPELIQVDAGRPAYRVTEADCSAACGDDLKRLARAGEALTGIHADAAGFSLWHYAGLESGVHMVYPGHGNYPEDYDPRQRPWYLTAVERAGGWLPLTIDASTRQPVLTATAPLYAGDGRLLGATAIDLPLSRLLSFTSESAPWLDVAHLALLRLNSQGRLEFVARKQAPDADQDWRRPAATEAFDALTPEGFDRVLSLQRGDSLLLENLVMNDQVWNLAITSLTEPDSMQGRRNWLALFAPHSATEAAVQAAVGVIEEARRASLQEHLYVALALALIAALVALYAAHRITMPLVRMSATARDLARGRLHSRTGLRRRDEIGSLSKSIDRMADSIEHLQLEQEQAYRDMIMTLHRALEKKDAYTAGHSGRVTRTSLKLGQRIGLDADTLEILRFGALTHDLGKIGIADAILNKPAPLEGNEINIMRQHPTFSKTIMKPLVRFKEYAEIAGSHHEHWDGSGYPTGLKGEEIHLLARIVAIADAWDSMIGDRVYRKGMPVHEALGILERERDSGQFDPELLAEFITMMREEYPADRAARSGMMNN
ncbi:MAG: HD domain-containing phosphohydrolase [Halieaceae bacterium]|jgi:HD-GYP domain-containing protein (c-di-GMP phosphodiesterase class II)|nr:HD domain-containing phosphohydrolase [Halieaceae bacterium]